MGNTGICRNGRGVTFMADDHDVWYDCIGQTKRRLVDRIKKYKTLVVIHVPFYFHDITFASITI